MQTTIRYKVQGYQEGKGWVTLLSITTFTPQEAFAYIANRESGEFRVIKSVTEDNLVNQSIVRYEDIY